MLVRARATTAEALSKAEQTGDRGKMLRYQTQLADWDKLTRVVVSWGFHVRLGIIDCSGHSLGRCDGFSSIFADAHRQRRGLYRKSPAE